MEVANPDDTQKYNYNLKRDFENPNVDYSYLRVVEILDEKNTEEELYLPMFTNYERNKINIKLDGYVKDIKYNETSSSNIAYPKDVFI